MEQTFVGVYHLPVTAGELREMKCYFNPQKLNCFIQFMLIKTLALTSKKVDEIFSWPHITFKYLASNYYGFDIFR